ncbi:MAG: hypothetical protein E4H42_04835, partial [Chromatiales bacterium]
MSEKPNESNGMPDMSAMTTEFMQMLEKNQQAFAKLVATPPQAVSKMLDPFNVMGSFADSAK